MVTVKLRECDKIEALNAINAFMDAHLKCKEFFTYSNLTYEIDANLLPAGLTVTHKTTNGNE